MTWPVGRNAVAVEVKTFQPAESSQRFVLVFTPFSFRIKSNTVALLFTHARVLLLPIGRSFPSQRKVKLEFPSSQRYSPSTEIEIVKIGPWKLLFEEFNFHVPFQSGEGTRQPCAMNSAQTTTQASLSFLIDFALGSVRKSVNLIQEVPDETNATEIVQCDTPPKLSWLFGAVDGATAPPQFPGARPSNSQNQ